MPDRPNEDASLKRNSPDVPRDTYPSKNAIAPFWAKHESCIRGLPVVMAACPEGPEEPGRSHAEVTLYGAGTNYTLGTDKHAQKKKKKKRSWRGTVRSFRAFDLPSRKRASDGQQQSHSEKMRIFDLQDPWD